MSLYQKHRPIKLDEIIGNAGIVIKLKSYLYADNQPHVFLFSGGSGCGKTSLSRIMACEFGCLPQDIIELNSANFRGIDTVRDIIQQVRFKPLSGGKKAWIFDECHQLSKDAQSAMLKLLEDVPDYVYFFLATTEPQKLSATITNRCVHLTVQNLPENRIIFLIKQVCKKEGINISSETEKAIAENSYGSPRQALNLLESIMNTEPTQQKNIIQMETEKENEAIDLCRALVKKKDWKEISTILESLKDKDPEGIRLLVLKYCSKVLLSGRNDPIYLIMDSFKNPFYNTGHAGLISACYEAMFK